MTTKVKSKVGLSSFWLKVLACVFMFIDHFGVSVFPNITAFRIIGRLAFPIFAFLISEGCHYTKNRLKHFLNIFILGVLCEAVYIIYDGRYYGNILLTFSLSVVLIYCLQEIKRCVFSKDVNKSVMFFVAFTFVLVGAFVFNSSLGVDYGFYGVITPVIMSVFYYKPYENHVFFKKTNNNFFKILGLSLGLLLVCFNKNALNCQAVSLLAVPIICLYNGRLGRYKLKYAFYLFYPLHLLLIQLITMIVR
jgi:hypothetical protein